MRATDRLVLDREKGGVYYKNIKNMSQKEKETGKERRLAKKIKKNSSNALFSSFFCKYLSFTDSLCRALRNEMTATVAKTRGSAAANNSLCPWLMRMPQPIPVRSKISKFTTLHQSNQTKKFCGHSI